MHKQLALVYLLFFILCTNGFAEGMSVAFTGAEIRSAPNAISSKVIANVSTYTPLQVLEKGAEYYKVKDYRGRTGWIHRTLLNSKPGIVVTGDRANVRQGPGTNHSVIFQLAEADSCRLLSKQEKWLEVQSADGHKGWVADFLTWGR